MVLRLTELFRVGDKVEIYLEQRSEQPNVVSEWRAGTVVALDHPGVWVETVSGTRWFVTNRRRIRHAER